jgi:tetratricopeptide (TPR) repeat protein
VPRKEKEGWAGKDGTALAFVDLRREMKSLPTLDSVLQQGVTTMTQPSRNRSFLPLLGALVLFTVAPAVRAQGSGLQDDAARAMQRGERLVQQKEYKAASAEFERASELAGGPCPDCLLGVGRAYSGARQYDAALQVTRMALTLFASADDQARAYDQLGTILALKGEMSAAREAYGKAVQLDGRMAGQVRSSLAQALLKRANYERAKTEPGTAAIQQVASSVGTPQR